MARPLWLSGPLGRKFYASGGTYSNGHYYINGRSITGKNKSKNDNLNSLEAKQFDLNNALSTVTNNLANMYDNLYNAKQQYIDSNGGTIFTNPAKDVYYAMSKKDKGKVKSLKSKYSALERLYNINNSAINNLESTMQIQQQEAQDEENESNSDTNTFMGLLMNVLGMVMMFIK